MSSSYNSNIEVNYESDIRFLNLMKMDLAKYGIIYKTSGCNSLADLFQLKSKDQLVFQQFVEVQQQLNLIYVDSVFPYILADLALDVLLGNISCLEEYILTGDQFKISEFITPEIYFNYKLRDFLEYLLYSDIAENRISTGTKNFDKIFGTIIDNNEFMFYTLYERSKLYDYLMKNMKLEIDMQKSQFLKNELILYVKFVVL